MNWTYRTDTDGPVVEREPENPWLAEPKTIHHRLLYDEAMDVYRTRYRGELVDQMEREHQVVSCDSPPHIAAEINRLYSLAGKPAPWRDLRKRHGDDLQREGDRMWAIKARELGEMYRKGDL